MNAPKRPAVDKFGKAVATQLRARRAHQEMTQQELAERTGISQSQLSKQLRGFRAINLDEFEAICDALDIAMEMIIEAAEIDIRDNVRDLSEHRGRRQPHANPPENHISELPYVADSTADEPEMGDDGYHDGP